MGTLIYFDIYTTSHIFCPICPNIKKEVIYMTEIYTKQLIDLLNDKIRRLEQEKDSQRKEINRLKKELSDYKRRCDA